MKQAVRRKKTKLSHFNKVILAQNSFPEKKGQLFRFYKTLERHY